MAQLERNRTNELLFSGRHVEVLIEFEPEQSRVESVSSEVTTVGTIAPPDFFDIPLHEGSLSPDYSVDSSGLSVTLPTTEKIDRNTAEADVSGLGFTSEEIMIQSGER